MVGLIDRLKPCGPVVDPHAASRTEDTLRVAAEAAGWGELLTMAWPALAPICGASSYLSGLMRRDPERLRQVLEADPQARFQSLLDRTVELRFADTQTAKTGLRRLKAEVHLLIALADLGGL